jgi:hypothetical protein
MNKSIFFLIFFRSNWHFEYLSNKSKRKLVGSISILSYTEGLIFDRKFSLAARNFQESFRGISLNFQEFQDYFRRLSAFRSFFFEFFKILHNIIFTFNCTFKFKIEFENYWKIMFVILLVACKFIVMKAEHTVVSYNGRDFTIKLFLYPLLDASESVKNTFFVTTPILKILIKIVLF